MRFTSKNFGHVIGVIAANLFSPSWLVMPLCFHALAKVSNIHLEEAFKSPEAILMTTMQYHDAIVAHPYAVFSVLIGCCLLMMGLGTGYTILLARIGGRVAIWCEERVLSRQFTFSLPKLFPTNNSLVSLD